MIHGIDVATYQRDLSDDMPRIKRLGARFVIAKATQDEWTDGAFVSLFRAAKNAGMIVGAYHFLEEPSATGGPGHTPEVQAAAFVRAVKGANGGTLDGALLALDIEPYAPRKSNPRYSDVRRWVAAFRKLAGNNRPLFIYTRGGVWSSFGNPRIRNDLGSRTYLWTANWIHAPGRGFTQGYGGLKPVIHQHGPFPRLRPRIVDGNVFNGSVAQLRAYTRPKVEDPAPPVEPDPVEPAPLMIGRWCHRLTGAPLLPGLELEAVATAAFGVPLQVAAGPSGVSSVVGGAPSQAFAVVVGLADRPVDPPLLVALADLALERPDSIPPYMPPSSGSLPPEAGPPG